MNFPASIIFRQLFDKSSSTFTYLLADANTSEAIVIDPVLDNIQSYLNLLSDLNLTLTFSIDTHTHADHITGSGRLRDETGCQTALGAEAGSACVGVSFKDGHQIPFGRYQLKALHTPGHTSDSYCFLFEYEEGRSLFTGDTLLIRGTGRTDFQQGSSKQQYESLFNHLLTYPDTTWVYPGHDYKGWNVSTIGEEKQCNPRLQVTSAEEYIAIMDNLKLPDPQLMDIAVPANRACGTSLKSSSQ